MKECHECSNSARRLPARLGGEDLIELRSARVRVTRTSAQCSDPSRERPHAAFRHPSRVTLRHSTGTNRNCTFEVVSVAI